MLVVRETPLSDIHLENMLKLSRMGAVMLPPVPAFYTNPVTLDDMVDQTVCAGARSVRTRERRAAMGRVTWARGTGLNQRGFVHDLAPRCSHLMPGRRQVA